MLPVCARPLAARTAERRHHDEADDLRAASLRDGSAAGAAQGDRQFIGAWQFLEMPKSELLEELGGGAVQQRSTDALTAADDVDQAALVQRPSTLPTATPRISSISARPIGCR